jgi:DNA-binding beta-propeller fold protein YncE
MKRAILGIAVLLAAVIAVGCVGTGDPAPADQATAPRPGMVPRFEVDPAWPTVPAKWRLGNPSSIAIDAKGNVWVLHRPRTLKPDQAAMAAPAIVIFDAEGKFVRAWGGPASGYEWPDIEHGIHIDHKGHVWVGGNNCPARKAPGLKPVWDDQVLKFTQDGKFVLQIGRSNQGKGNADTKNLHGPADVWVHPRTNELFVADGYFNNRVAVFDADSGEFKRMWGAFGNKPAGDPVCPPVGLKTVPDGPGPDQFRVAHAIRVANDGTVYVADRENRRVQMFTREGKFLKQYVRHNAPFARNLALSPDPEQRFLYVGGGVDIVVMDRRTLEVVEVIGGPGFLGGGHQIATDSKGNIYVAATGRGMQKLTFKGMVAAQSR